MRLPKLRRGTKAYREAVGAARRVIGERIRELNQAYGYKFGRIAIRDTRTRWGSCSKKGNLNFNYRTLYLPDALRDYVIVHELCHLEEFNHSQAFWVLVARAMPDWKARRKELQSKYAL